MRLRCVSLFALAVVGLVSPLKAAAPVGASQTDPPVYKTHAREVVVDVVVTQGHDAPVNGLRAKDFVVMEDGKPQTVDYFEEHSTRTLPPGELKPLPPMPPGVFTNVPPAPPSDAVNVLLLDSLNTDQQDQTYVHQQILDFLKTMQPGIRVAVFVLGEKLRMVQGFTTDTSILRDALNDQKFGMKPTRTSASRTLSDKVDDAQDLQRMWDLGISPTGLEAITAMQAGVSSYQGEQRVGMTFQALDNIGRFLATHGRPPGRPPASGGVAVEV